MRSITTRRMSSVMRGWESTNRAKSPGAIASAVTGSTAETLAERGLPSNAASSPMSSPGPQKPMTASCPSSVVAYTLTRPLSINNTRPGGSPWWKRTARAAKRRVTACSLSSRSSSAVSCATKDATPMGGASHSAQAQSSVQKCLLKCAEVRGSPPRAAIRLRRTRESPTEGGPNEALVSDPEKDARARVRVHARRPAGGVGAGIAGRAVAGADVGHDACFKLAADHAAGRAHELRREDAVDRPGVDGAPDRDRGSGLRLPRRPSAPRTRKLTPVPLDGAPSAPHPGPEADR